MDFLFLNSSFHSRRKDELEFTEPHLRIGVAGVAAFTREIGADVGVFDPHTLRLSAEEAAARIVSMSPRRVCLPAYTEEIQDASRIAEWIKAKSPKTTTIIGGCHVTALPEMTLKEFECFDYGVVGEGERALGEIFAGRDPSQTPGIVYRGERGELVYNPSDRPLLDMDALPRPAWDLYDLTRYKDPLPIEPLRGCPFSCHFCCRSMGSKVIYKSSERFVDELVYFRRLLGKNRFRFVAGAFPLKKSHAVDICLEIIKRGVRVRWVASTRVDTLDRELATLLKSAGCECLQLGVESGSVDLLRATAKGITPRLAEETVRICKEAGLDVGLNFIIGLPFETRETVRSTLELALRLRKYAVQSNCAILVPFPGTRIYEMALNNQNGLSFHNTDWSNFGKQSGLVLKHQNFSDGELKGLQSRFYLEYYLGAPLQALRMFSFKRAWLVIKRLFSKK